MKVQIDKRLFNKAYWVLCKAVARFVILYGGSNSSKSWSNYQHLILWILQQPQGSNAIIYRKQGSTLRNSVYENLKLITRQFKMAHLFEFYFSGDKREIICKANGNRIVMSGLDDPDKMKSIVGIKRVVLEEADAFEQNDFTELERRFRGQSGIQFVIVFNPVSEQHWIKRILFDTPSYAEKGERHLFTIDDNRFATAEDYEALERLRDIDEDQYQIYRWGKWGVIKALNPYLLHLNRQRNGGERKHNPTASILLSFDFNIKNSVGVFQKWKDQNGWHFQCIREVRMGGSEDTDLEALCRELARAYGKYQIIYTGDASGNNRSALSKGNKEAFRLIQGYLAQYGARFVTYHKLKANPRLKRSRFVTNAITKELGPNFGIDDSCTELWADVVRVPCNAEGDLDKSFCDKNDIGHMLDVLRYSVLVFCFDIWQDIRQKIAVPKEFDMESNNVEQDAYKDAA